MSTLLQVEGLWAGYRDAIVLRDVSLEVADGELVAIVGANGAGKSTLLSAICGQIPTRRGRTVFAGQDITRLQAHAAPERGLVIVPEGGRLFTDMSVLENLELGAYHRSARAALRQNLAEAFEFFPRLAERRNQLAGSLSGGERQMCAVARAMMAQPRLLMLDEPSLGLSPIMVERLFELLERLIRAKGLTVILVEQNVGDALAMAARGYVLEHGQIAMRGTGAELLHDPEVQHAYLGLTETT